MARIVVLVDDLLFGSNVAGALSAAGHEVQLVASVEELGASGGGSELLVVDLAGGALDPAGALSARPNPSVRTLASYAHVHPGQREAALAAGFDRVVPRSKLAREAPELVAELLAHAHGER